jgi:hypothetical protein
MALARVTVILMLSVALAHPPVSRAQASSDPTAAALAAALGKLRQAAPGTRGGPILDPRLRSLESSPELSEEFSDLAAAIFSDLVAQYDGDPERMAEVLAKGQSNPEAFARTLRPATRAKLEQLTRKLEASAP